MSSSTGSQFLFYSSRSAAQHREALLSNPNTATVPFFTALLDPTVYIYMLYLLRHKSRGVGEGVGSRVSGNCPGFETKSATPLLTRVKVVRSELAERR